MQCNFIKFHIDLLVVGQVDVSVDSNMLDSAGRHVEFIRFGGLLDLNVVVV